MTSAPSDLQFVCAKQMVGIHNVHKSIYCGHLCDNRSREAPLCSGTAQAEMGAVTALREFLIPEEQKGRQGVQVWKDSTAPCSDKGLCDWARGEALPFSLVMSDQDPTPASAQGQAGWGFEQPALVEGALHMEGRWEQDVL